MLPMVILLLFFTLTFAFTSNSELIIERGSIGTRRMMVTTSEDGGNTSNSNNQRVSSRRWNGNYRHASNKLSEVSKAKKLKIDLVSNGVTKTVEKKRMETVQHVLTKAIIWSLYMEEYPNLEIEYDIGDPDYLPDVISVVKESSTQEEKEEEEPLFWGESGRMKVHKAVDLMQRYPKMHIVHARWSMDIESISQPLEDYLKEQFELGELDLSDRQGRFTFLSLPLDVWRFIDEDTREIRVKKEDLQWKELDFPQ